MYIVMSDKQLHDFVYDLFYITEKSDTDRALKFTKKEETLQEQTVQMATHEMLTIARALLTDYSEHRKGKISCKDTFDSLYEYHTRLLKDCENAIEKIANIQSLPHYEKGV